MGGRVSALEETLLARLSLAGLPAPEREASLVPGRRFRCDLVWRDHRLVCEVEGGVWSGGRHTSGTGYTRDCEKYSLLALEGWTVIRVTGTHIRSGQALEWIQRGLTRKQARS